MERFIVLPRCIVDNGGILLSDAYLGNLIPYRASPYCILALKPMKFPPARGMSMSHEKTVDDSYVDGMSE